MELRHYLDQLPAQLDCEAQYLGTRAMLTIDFASANFEEVEMLNDWGPVFDFNTDLRVSLKFFNSDHPIQIPFNRGIFSSSPSHSERTQGISYWKFLNSTGDFSLSIKVQEGKVLLASVSQRPIRVELDEEVAS